MPNIDYVEILMKLLPIIFFCYCFYWYLIEIDLLLFISALEAKLCSIFDWFCNQLGIASGTLLSTRWHYIFYRIAVTIALLLFSLSVVFFLISLDLIIIYFFPEFLNIDIDDQMFTRLWYFYKYHFASICTSFNINLDAAKYFFIMLFLYWFFWVFKK